MSHFKNLIGLAVICGLSFSCTKKSEGTDAETAKAAASDTLLIGEYGSLTGPAATFGQSTHNGIVLAFEEQNKLGGVKAKKLVLLTEDDEGKPDTANAVVTRLITQKKVLAIIGEVASSNSKAAAPTAQRYKIPMISPSSTNPEVTEIGDYIFRACFIDPFQGKVMAKFAFENLKAKKVAILKDVKSDYSVGLAKFFKETFIKLGGTVVVEQNYQANEMDFKSQLTDIKNKKPDAIFIPGYYSDVGLIARQARQLDIKVPLLGGDGWDSAKLFEIGKEAINGNYFLNHYTTESSDPAVLEFIKNFKARFNNETPDGLAALGYDSAKILIAAMEKSDLTSKSIRDELAKIKDFKAVTGKISINAQRNAEKSGIVVKVDGPVNRYVTTFYPDQL